MRALVKGLMERLPFKGAIFAALRPLGLPERLFRHLYFTGVIGVDVGDGARFRMRHMGHHWENDLFWRGYGRGVEGCSLRIWRELARTSANIADIGANTGAYALAAAALNPSARILAMEPVQRVFEKLEKNVALNGFGIIVVSRAASSTNGVAVLHDAESEHVYSASLNPEMLGAAATRKTEIRTARLDDLLPEHGFSRIDLMKIDVERHEPEVLEGMAAFLRDGRPTMLIEVLDREIGARVERCVEGLGYRFFQIDEAAIATPVERLGEGGLSDRNYLLCSAETAARLRGKGLIGGAG